MINTEVSSRRLKLFRYLIHDELFIKKGNFEQIKRDSPIMSTAENVVRKLQLWTCVYCELSTSQNLIAQSSCIFLVLTRARRLNPFFLNNFSTSRVKIARKNKNTFLPSNLNYEKYSLTCLELTRFFQCCGLPPELGTVRGFPHSSRDHLIYSLMDHISSTDH